jgi:molecular chaperone Hsp33
MLADVVLRAITQDGAFRVITARTTSSARGVTEAQTTKGPTTQVLAELLTGTILMREAMAPDLRVQGLLKMGKGQVVADAYPGGATRALVHEGGGPVDPAAGGVLQMMRSLHNGAVHQGIVQVAGGDVSTALMEYMQSSEQVASFVSVAAVVKDNVVEVAGGYLVQLLPEVGRAPLMVMTERLADFAPLSSLLTSGKGAPEDLMGELLYAMPYEIVGRSTVRYECTCDDTRVAASLASLPKKDIREILADGKVLEIQCDYCRREYRFAPEKLRGLLAQS